MLVLVVALTQLVCSILLLRFKMLSLLVLRLLVTVLKLVSTQLHFLQSLRLVFYTV